MASLDDVVTTQKSGVIGINALTAALTAFKDLYEAFVGSKTYLGISSASLIVSGPGRLVSFSVNVAGGAAGTIHDAASVDGATTANALVVIPTAVTTGVISVSMPFTNGLVVKPGSSHVVSLTYSD